MTQAITRRRIAAAALAVVALGTAACTSPSVSGAPAATPPSTAVRDLAAKATTPLTAHSASALSASDTTFLRQLATRTWNFFGSDLDPTTHLPRNNVPVSGSSNRSDYTSPTEIGLFLTALVAAQDLKLDTPDHLQALATSELATLKKLQTYQGFPLRWYQASTGAAIGGPGGLPLTDPFVSTVDDAWYALGLVLMRSAFPADSSGYGQLLSAMNFSLLYDQASNQLYTGYHVDSRSGSDADTDTSGQPSSGDYKLLYGGTRIADYLAIGTRTVPGRLWWGVQVVPTTSRQRQQPVTSQVSVRDPQSGQSESQRQGYYTYQGIKFVPTFAGSLFQALAPALAAPELSDSPGGLGLNDRNSVLAQIAYAASLKYPVWGFAPASTPARLNGYAQYGADALATKAGAIPHDAVAPYASALALPVEPALAAQNLEALAKQFPSLYTDRGFLDSVDPVSGTVAQRYMAVSQAVILAALDNALDGGALTQHFAADSVGQALAPYLRAESFPLT